MSKIGKYIPKSVKRPLIRLQYVPEKIGNKIYQAAAQGKIPFPDKAFQKWDYKIHTGRKLNMDDPVTYQEKLQWLKYNYHDPLYTTLVDKLAVREWISQFNSNVNLVPLLGIYNNTAEIDFESLPNEFMLKCTHDSGSVVICRDKSTFDTKEAKKILDAGLKRKQFYLSREWPYKNVTPRIICEEYLKDDQIDDAPDYKFFCFDGKVKALLVNSERHSSSGLKTNYYTPDWKFLPMREAKYPNNPKPDIRPEKLDEMIRLAELYSEGMPHVRVDFNYINNKIYFGEMTFYHCGGRMLFEPDKYNYLFGSWLNLPEKRR